MISAEHFRAPTAAAVVPDTILHLLLVTIFAIVSVAAFAVGYQAG